MADVFRELIKGSEIENRLTGTVKLANEERDPDYGVDRDVRLMHQETVKAGDGKVAVPAAGGARARAKLPPPAALSSEAAQQYEKMDRPLKPGGNASTTNKTQGTGTAAAPVAPPSN